MLLGWTGLGAGIATVLTVLAAETPLDALATAAFLPALLLTVVFHVWAGYEFWRSHSKKRHVAATNLGGTDEQLYPA